MEFDEWESGVRTGEIDMAYLEKVRNRLPFWKSADKFEIIG